VSKLPRLANRNSHLRQRVSLGWGEVADQPSPLRFAAPRPAREDARPAEIANWPTTLSGFGWTG